MHFEMRLRTREHGRASEQACATDGSRTGLLICDMWNAHWCRCAQERMHRLASKIDLTAQRARSLGLQVIHAPSGTMPFYRNYPERRQIFASERPPEVALLPINETPELPVDASDGGCDCASKLPPPVIFRQHLSISIESADVISDNGAEIAYFLRKSHISKVLFCGVHVNMCILDNSFGIKRMLCYGFECTLLRDLVDSMYSKRLPPFVSHRRATTLIVQHVERYICPTGLGRDIRP
jgi:nicotinamidase-related amidase